MLGGIALGIYVGFWLLFVGGIVQIINAFTPEGAVALDIAFGLIKICFSGVCGWSIGVTGIAVGTTLLK